ncbi:MAG: hypothetical protein ACXADA_04350 [Candidatus Hodarchaeales archaeon]
MPTIKRGCAYHPGRKSVTTCSKCKRPICAEDIRELKIDWGRRLLYCIVFLDLFCGGYGYGGYGD